jgi:hypothetical protein
MAAALTILVSAGSGTAATPGTILLTPAQVGKLLVSRGPTVWATTSGGYSTTVSQSKPTIESARCRGVGAARKGRYGGFTCSIREGGANPGQSATAWVRPWTATSLCASDSALVSCPPPLPAHPLPGDPRVCQLHADALSCILYSAEQAATQGLQAKGLATDNLGCYASAVFSYTCQSGTNTVTVTFAPQSTQWITVPVVNPGE